MQNVMPKTTRSRFIEILMCNPNINSLPSYKMREVIGKIMEDPDIVEILNPIIYDDEYVAFGDDLDTMSEIQFDDSRSDAEKAIAMEFLQKPKEEQKAENGEIISLESLKRIRAKRREYAEIPESGIVLTAEDYEDGENPDGVEVVMPNSYGRSPLHEAIGMRNLDSVKKYVGEGKYLDIEDNNGNTPYQMAYQEGYVEAVEVFASADIAV